MYVVCAIHSRDFYGDTAQHTVRSVAIEPGRSFNELQRAHEIALVWLKIVAGLRTVVTVHRVLQTLLSSTTRDFFKYTTEHETYTSYARKSGRKKQ